MKVLFLSKRYYMGHDAPVDRYGRLYYLPLELSRISDNEVLSIAIAYRDTPNIGWQYNGQYNCQSVSLCPIWFASIPRLFRELHERVKEFNPDVIISSSDVFCIIVGYRLAQSKNVPFIADLYDNYESFGMARIPGIKALYRNAITKADAVCCVSAPLTRYVSDHYRHGRCTTTLETTVDLSVFKPIDKICARQKLNLPLDSTLIGVAGSLSATHGIEVLYQAFEHLTQEHDNYHLILAGSTDSTISIPRNERVHHLGRIANCDVVYLFNALDVAVISMKDSNFGRYAFPQKTYEILACKTPLIAADVGALSELFRDNPECLYRIDDIDDLASKLELMIRNPKIVDLPVPTWADQADKLNVLIDNINKNI